MTDKEKSIIQEQYSTLYLRLNGYLTTGYIIHSDEKRIDGELDILALRFPFHKQEDTEHNSSDYLEIPLNIDIIIAEVKSKGQALHFNKCVRQKNTLSPWLKILSWSGVFEEKEICNVAMELNELVQIKENSQLKTLRSTKPIETLFGIITIRPIIFCPERINVNNSDKFINWNEMNNFIWQCLCPTEIRVECGTRYDFTAWGQGFEEIVKAYKSRQKDQTKFETIDELYNTIVDIRNKA